MDASGIGGAAIGAVFGELFALIIDVSKTAYHFKSKLNLIKSTLTSLQPLIYSIASANEEEIAMFVDQLEAGKKLVLKCSKIKTWDLSRKYIYSMKLGDFQQSLLHFFQIHVQAELAFDSKRTLLEVEELRLKMDRPLPRTSVERNDLGDKMDLVLSILENDGGQGYCDVPGLPDYIVGLDEPLKELKKMLLPNGVSVVVLSAPAGCGKTTLSTMLCKDKEIQDIYGKNTFFVTVSKTASPKDVVPKIFQHKGLQPPLFQNEKDAINQLEHLMRRLAEGGSILLILDDVWSEWESLIENFNFRIDHYKILVTSRFVFPRFDHMYKLNILNDKDAMALFRHSTLREDESSKLPDELVNKVVKGCKGLPLSLIVVGRSLHGRPVESWKNTLKKWPEHFSLHSDEKDLLRALQNSLDALDESATAKDCYLDLGSFPEDQKIPATVLMDMWVELYGLDEEGRDVLENLLELSVRNLVNLLRTRKGTIEVHGYCNEHYVIQSDQLRELAIYQSSQESIEQRIRLIMDISANSYPQWWVEQQQQPNRARLLSISTDETFTSTWYNMQLPSTEVLILNFWSRNYSLPQFIETMNKLKVLIVTNYGSCPVELNNFQVLSHSSNLKRIRLEHASIPSLTTSLLQLKNLRKISLMKCQIGKALAGCTFEIPNILPNLTELEIDYCDDLVEFPVGFCNLLRLKKLSITYCNELIGLPKRFGRLVKLEVLRIHSCTKLEELPESICGLHELSFLDISGCVGMSRMPEGIGELRCLKTLHMGGCWGLQELPTSVEDLQELEDVICDEEISYFWKYHENQLTKLKVNVIKEDIKR